MCVKLEGRNMLGNMAGNMAGNTARKYQFNKAIPKKRKFFSLVALLQLLTLSKAKLVDFLLPTLRISYKLWTCLPKLSPSKSSSHATIKHPETEKKSFVICRRCHCLTILFIGINTYEKYRKKQTLREN